MPKELNEANAKEAFLKVVESTGIGAAASNPDGLMAEKVKVAVPQDMHDGYPARLLASANNVCTNEPYGWRVTQQEPNIENSTIFSDLYLDWFQDIVWPA